MTTAERRFDRQSLKSPLDELVVSMEPGTPVQESAAVVATLLDRLHGGAEDYTITVPEALHAYTLGAAYASGEETVKGSLTPGKLADLVILDRNIFRIPPREILTTRVVATYVKGERVFGGKDGLQE